MKNLTNPHDKFFKKNMEDPEVAQDFIRRYLPEKLIQTMDLKTLSIQKDSFIQSDLQEYFSDILYQVQMQGTESYLYLLFEHKSYPYPDIALQLLGYIVNIYQNFRKLRKHSKLPVVVPFVFYHGREPWKSEPEFSSLIADYGELGEELKSYIPDFRYLLYDASRYDEEELQGDIPLQIVLRTLKYIFVQDEERFIQSVLKTIQLIEALPDAQRRQYRFEQVMHYIFYARKDLDLTNMEKEMREISIERSEQLMSIAEKLMKQGWEDGLKQGIRQGREEGREQGREEGREQGREEGREQGREQGLEEGREESMLRIAKNMLDMGSEIPFIIRATGLSEEKIQTLQKRELE